MAKNDTVKICEIKRLLGKDYSDIEDMLKYFPFKIIKDPNSERPMIQMTFDKKKISIFFSLLFKSSFSLFFIFEI